MTVAAVLDEIWKDALGGVFKCTVAGTPGTWKQLVPAPVTADPASGTIPTGYLIFNVTQGTLKRLAGSYDWQTVIGSTGSKIGFYGATPVVQPSGADQTAVTLGNTNGEIGGLTISDPPTQAEVQALREPYSRAVGALSETRPSQTKERSLCWDRNFHRVTRNRSTKICPFPHQATCVLNLKGTGTARPMELQLAGLT